MSGEGESVATKMSLGWSARYKAKTLFEVIGLPTRNYTTRNLEVAGPNIALRCTGTVPGRPGSTRSRFSS